MPLYDTWFDYEEFDEGDQYRVTTPLGAAKKYFAEYIQLADLTIGEERLIHVSETSKNGDEGPEQVMTFGLTRKSAKGVSWKEHAIINNYSTQGAEQGEETVTRKEGADVSVLDNLSGAFKRGAKAFGEGSAAATIGMANTEFRDQFYASMGDSVPPWAELPVVKNGVLVLPPAMMLFMAQMAPAMKLPIPDQALELLEEGALLGLNHAGMKNTEELAKFLWEILKPYAEIYMRAASQHRADKFLAEEIRTEEKAETVRERVGLAR